MVDRLYAVRAVHGEDSLPWTDQQPHAPAHDGAEGSFPLQNDQARQVWRAVLRRAGRFPECGARSCYGHGACCLSGARRVLV